MTLEVQMKSVAFQENFPKFYDKNLVTRSSHFPTFLSTCIAMSILPCFKHYVFFIDNKKSFGDKTVGYCAFISNILIISFQGGIYIPALRICNKLLCKYLPVCQLIDKIVYSINCYTSVFVHVIEDSDELLMSSIG